MWIFADFPLAVYYSTSNIISPGKKTDNKREVFVVKNARRQKIWMYSLNDIIQRQCTELNFSIPKTSNLLLNI